MIYNIPAVDLSRLGLRRKAAMEARHNHQEKTAARQEMVMV
jgi:hypothetical protein